MNKVLLVGEHPFSQTGNGNMMLAVLNQIDSDKYNIACFAANEIDASLTAFNPLPISIIPANEKDDIWGHKKIIDVIKTIDFDILCMVGIDIWRYGNEFKEIAKQKKKKNFKWIAIFPYDLQTTRTDWLELINYIDFPYVYSQYGETILKKDIPHIKYFRPPLSNLEYFSPLNEQQRNAIRDEMFGKLPNDAIVFGFMGRNQIRKDPQRLIKAFYQAKEKQPNIYLYLHTELNDGTYNLKDLLDSYIISSKEIKPAVFYKNQGIPYFFTQITQIYNGLDCVVNCSLQEGLSWTLLEAMLSGVPIIASDTTAQTELVKDTGLLIPCEELTYMPIWSAKGQTWTEAKCCKIDDISDTIVKVAQDKQLRLDMQKKGLKKADEWANGISNINNVLEDSLNLTKAKGVSKIKKILFAQESAAGDVLMTTRCFKGLKEKHLGLPLVYMTKPQYMDIVEGNPYVDEVIPWNVLSINQYLFTYTPHQERILNGVWGHGSVGLLSDLYWRLLEVEPDEFFIQKNKPKESVVLKIKKESNICIIHTTGGDSALRTYTQSPLLTPHLRKKGYYTVQLGASNDFPAYADLDLRGILSFRETAWVMSKAKVAVTVDSFISHLAGALGISQVCLFGCGAYNTVRPVQTKGLLICRSPNYIKDCHLLGHCAGQERTCEHPCIKVHKPEDIALDVVELEQYKEKEPKVVIKMNNFDNVPQNLMERIGKPKWI